MRPFRWLLAVAVLALGGRPVQAQFGRVQDSTLIGIHRLLLNYTTPLGDSVQLREGFALELRKAGIRVLARGDSADALMNVVVWRKKSGACEVRVDVEQMARIVRTSRAYPIVTWFYWDDADSPCRDSWLRDGSRRAVDSFLTKWLDVNGR